MNRYDEILRSPADWVTPLQARYLRGPSLVSQWFHRGLHGMIVVLVRTLFRFRVVGATRLPSGGPFILAPNHSSPLDAQLLAAALPYGLVRQTVWAGKESTVLKTWWRRFLSWHVRILPIADDASALAPASLLLREGHVLVWFPEGVRSRDGTLLEFRSGVVRLAHHHGVNIVPVYLRGAHAACPSSWTWPRWGSRVEVCIGERVDAASLGVAPGQEFEATLSTATDRLRERVAALAEKHTVKDD